MPIVTTVLDAELGTKLWIGLKGTTVWTAYVRCPFAFHFSMHEDRNKFLSGFVPRTGRVALEKDVVRCSSEVAAEAFEKGWPFRRVTSGVVDEIDQIENYFFGGHAVHALFSIPPARHL